MMPTVLVVIVHYRTPALTIDCLRSLEAEIRAYRNASVVVVDNQSQDGSAARIAEAIRSQGWSGWARLVESPVNGGFAYGNNHVIGPALATANPPDYFWLLNPDTTIYPGSMTSLIGWWPVPGTLARTVAWMASGDSAASVTSEGK